MKKLFLLLALPFVALTTQAQEAEKTQDCKKVRPNYALAERFSPKKVGQMVKSTSVKKEATTSSSSADGKNKQLFLVKA